MLGITLQQHSWLQDELLHKISILVFKSLHLHLIMNYNEHVNEWNGFSSAMC